MKQTSTSITSLRLRAVGAGLLFLFLPALSSAAAPTVFASGLKNPSRIITATGGTFLVTETAATNNSSRVTLLSSSGAALPLIDGLPSGLSAPNNDPDGANGLALNGNTLYVAIGEGDSLANGTAPGTTVGNPKGVASPILDCVLQVVFSTSVDKITAGFTLKSADHFTLIDGNPVVLKNTAGDTATLTLLTVFRTQPDPKPITRNSHPYSLALSGSNLFLADAGLNEIVQIDPTTGRYKVITHFDNPPNIAAGPPNEEAVPDSVHVFGDFLLVSQLTGFPFTPGNSRVMLVDPRIQLPSQRVHRVFILSDRRPCHTRNRTAQRASWCSEYSANMLGGAPGRVKSYDTPLGQVVVDNLTTPSSMVLSGSTLYITDRSEGTVLSVSIQ